MRDEFKDLQEVLDIIMEANEHERDNAMLYVLTDGCNMSVSFGNGLSPIWTSDDPQRYNEHEEELSIRESVLRGLRTERDNLLLPINQLQD